MSSGQRRGLSFRTSAGEVVRVHDCVCWRHLEGRPCRTAQERQIAESVDVVVIPVIPAGHGNSKRACKGDVPPATIPSTAAGFFPASAHDPTANDAPENNGISKNCICRGDLLRWCAAAQVALAAGGLRAAVDDCPRQTPGAKYNAWENRGVFLRVEVGSREVAAGAFSLALHPCLAHLMTPAAHAANMPVAVEPASAGAAGGKAGRGEMFPDHEGALALAAVSEAGAHGSGCGGRSGGLRLGGLSREELVATCRTVLAQARGVAATEAGAAAVAGNGPAAAAAGAAAGGSPQPPAGRWCRKLHLWPDLVAAAGSTEAAVAALLTELTAAEAAAGTSAASARQNSGEGRCDGSCAHTDAPAVENAAVRVRGGGDGDDEGAGDGHVVGLADKGKERPAAAASGVAGERPVGQRPCVAHLRHLLQLGRACYCGRGHYSLQQLQREVERCIRGSGGGGGGGGRMEDLQQPPQQQTAAVLTWLDPPQPKAGQQQRSLRHQQPRANGPSRGGRAAAAAGSASRDAAEGAPDEEGEERAWIGAGGLCRRITDEGVQGDDEEEEDGGCGNRVVLLVGNIPSAVRASTVQGELAAAFEPFGCCGVAVSRTRGGGSHGWARVSLSCPSGEEATAAAAAAAVAALGGRLRLGGAPLTVSYSSGRLDTIFPYLPYVVRSAMRVDSTAAFSATDQCTADLMTDLLAGLAEKFIIASVDVRRQPIPPHPAPPAPRPLLPLVLTDGTACCGGNALSFAWRFRQVVALELDEDRAWDLRHNAALVRAWAAFRSAGGRPRPRSSTGSSSAEARATIALNAASSPTARPVNQPTHGSDPSPVASCPTPGSSPPLALCSSADAANGVCGGGDCSMGTGAGVAEAASGCSRPGSIRSSNGFGAMGELEVLCGDYSELMGSLRQDIVFMDPPWGGPQYRGATGATAQPKPAGVSFGSGCGSAAGPLPPSLSSLRSSPAARSGGGARALEYGDTVFTLGQEPVSYMVSELLVSGAAGMVALKLPSRADAELRAMQARVRQLVAAGLRGGKGSGGGCGARVCRPRLLGAEVTLGRSALVVFMMLPYKYDDRAEPQVASADDATARVVAGGVDDVQVASGGASGDASGGAPGGGGGGGVGSGAASVRDGGEGPPASVSDGGVENGAVDTYGDEDDEALEPESVRHSSDGGGGGARHGGGVARSSRVEDCPACGGGLSVAFRAALREICSGLGLPYRLVCE